MRCAPWPLLPRARPLLGCCLAAAAGAFELRLDSDRPHVEGNLHGLGSNGRALRTEHAVVAMASNWPNSQAEAGAAGHLLRDVKDVMGGALPTDHAVVAVASNWPSPQAAETSSGVDEHLLREIKGDMRAGSSPSPRAKAGLGHFVAGAVLAAAAMAIQWLNEERSARMSALLRGGLRDCVTIDAECPDPDNRGRLVHLQGKLRGARALADGQFEGAVVEDCLKLQSTVEVFEWVPSPRTTAEDEEKRCTPGFRAEWTTVHHDSLRFRKPSPENPRLPSGLTLGTRTKTCGEAELGGFVLDHDALVSFHRFEPAMHRLPDRLFVHRNAFFANRADGYYYMRPGAASRRPDLGIFDTHQVGYYRTRLAETSREPEPGLFDDHQVGDVRARFMCVPGGDATVVGVQCERGGSETFAPYRAVPRAPWASWAQEKQRRAEEGKMPPVREAKSRREPGCGAGGMAACCCCACGLVAQCCKQEVVTEEIFFVSDRLEPKEKAFQWVVRRNPCRVWSLRLSGWALLLLGVSMAMEPFSAHVRVAPSLRVYGSLACPLLSLVVALSASSLIVAAANAGYRTSVAALWLLAANAVLAAPFVGAHFAHKP